MTQLQEIKLLGITARTNNASEMDQNTAKIGATMHKYSSEQLASKIPNRKHPGVTYCVYTDYENDMNGDYTYFIGEEVSEFSEQQEGLQKLVIPAQKYTKFTSDRGAMPMVCINLWQKIWQEFDGQRGYIADFELYDARAADPQNTVMDIYIGIQNS